MRSGRFLASVIQRRGMATEKQLKMRITATNNISKITKSMKMVSASKLRGEQTRLNAARPFAAWTSAVTGEPKVLEGLETEDIADNSLFVICATDKGLCGGVNGIMARQTKAMLKKLEASNKNYSLLVCGEKGRALFRRSHTDKIVANITDRTSPYTFTLSSAIANEVVKGEYGGVHILYNKFKSAISYIPSMQSITPIVDPNIDLFQSQYDMEPEADPESLANFYEYVLSSQIYHAMMENATSEQSARMTAMENASKNAKEMISKLTLVYNRARQTRITTELIEIISGAAALESKN